MQYQSIIRLFEYCNIDCDAQDAGKIKKILSAEFSIADSGIISIDGFDYTKNDVLLELERDDFAQRLEYHKQVWSNKHFLACIETHTVVSQFIYTWVAWKNDAGFVNFISPYFAETFDKVMRRYLHVFDFREAVIWLPFRAFISHAEDEEKAFSGVRLLLIDFTHLLKNANSVTYVDIIRILENWADQSSGAALVNNLPGSMYKLTDDLVKAMVNFTVVIQDVNKNLCYEVSCELTQIMNINPELQRLIADNHGIYRSRLATKSKGNNSGALNIIVFFCCLIPFFATVCTHVLSSSSEKKKATHVTSTYFNNLRNQYATIDTTSYNGVVFNQNRMIIGNMPYYMMFENSDTTATSTCVYIVHDGARHITLYLKSSSGIVIPLTVKPSERLKIERNKNTIDILLDNSTNAQINFSPAPILISDSLNLSAHRLEFDSPDGVINIDLPKKRVSLNGEEEEYYEDGFVLKINSKRLEDKFLVDYLSFPGSHWINPKERGILPTSL